MSVLSLRPRALLGGISGTVGAVLLVVICAAAVMAPFISPQNPYDLAQLNILNALKSPGFVDLEGHRYLLGTDAQGRDIISAIFYGLRISLGVGVSSAVIACLIGATVGVISAYWGGATDAFVTRVIDLQLAFPGILIALVLLATLGRGLDKVMIALIMVQWAYYARTVRGSALVERSKEYVEAGRCLSLSKRRIIFSHILPNCLPPLIVVVTVQIAQAIILESTLSFLGVGVPVTEPSLGMLVANGYPYVLAGNYWLTVFPGATLALTIIAINLVGDRLRDLFNPRRS